MKHRSDQPHHSSAPKQAGSPRLHRRALLKGMGLTALGSMAGLGIGCALPRIRREVSEGELLINPTEVSADNGLLNVTIKAQYGQYRLAGKDVMLRCYDGKPIGNTLRVKTGDTLRLTLENHLPYDPLQELCTAVPTVEDNTPKGFNVTNMHVHGVHVSPESPSDNILLLVGYKQTEHYRYEIPSDHPPGTYFYHAHFHGSVALQVASGMAGALIIEGPLDEIPEIKAAKEQVLCFQTPRVNKTGVCENYTVLDQPGDTLINGQLKPVIRMSPGEVQRWRLVNASHMDNMLFGIQDQGFTALCFDGNPLDYSKIMDTAVLIPGNRADILVKAGAEPRRQAIYRDISQEDSEDNIIAWLEVTADTAKDMPLYSGALPRPDGLDDIEPEEVTFGRRLEFGMSGDPKGRKYTVNGQPFSCLDAWQIPLNAVEEWEVYNHTSESHPFHIHVNPFQMISGGDVEPGTWLDTVNLKPFERIRFRTRFQDFTGTFVFHCHNLTHEDLGMMQAVNVYKP
ncbi:multicopper oxidase family protein [Oceanospirillum sp.]|uniref:multicopper oxidase family protein n=1 Tax=Oceanospirillum sp. TaxID=2021254 RepID=UPI003A913B28